MNPLAMSGSWSCPPLCQALHRLPPALSLHQAPANNYIRYEHMFMYDCDFCITADAGFTPLAGNSDSHPDGTVCPGSPEAASWPGGVHPPEGGSPYPFVASNRRKTWNYCLKAGFRPNIIANATTGPPMRPSCAMGVGISVVPEITPTCRFQRILYASPSPTRHRAQHQPDL